MPRWRDLENSHDKGNMMARSHSTSVKAKGPMGPDDGTKVSQRNFSLMVEAWNHLKPRMRNARAEECIFGGHKYRETPFSSPDHVSHVCIRCLKYTHE